MITISLYLSRLAHGYKIPFYPPLIDPSPDLCRNTVCHHVVQDLIYAAAHDLESQIEINHVSFQLSGAFPTFVCGHLVSSAPPLPSMNIDYKWDALSGGYCISDS